MSRLPEVIYDQHITLHLAQTGGSSIVLEIGDQLPGKPVTYQAAEAGTNSPEEAKHWIIREVPPLRVDYFTTSLAGLPPIGELSAEDLNRAYGDGILNAIRAEYEKYAAASLDEVTIAPVFFTQPEIVSTNNLGFQLHTLALTQQMGGIEPVDLGDNYLPVLARLTKHNETYLREVMRNRDSFLRDVFRPVGQHLVSGGTDITLVNGTSTIRPSLETLQTIAAQTKESTSAPEQLYTAEFNLPTMWLHQSYINLANGEINERKRKYLYAKSQVLYKFHKDCQQQIPVNIDRFLAEMTMLDQQLEEMLKTETDSNSTV